MQKKDAIMNWMNKTKKVMIVIVMLLAVSYANVADAMSFGKDYSILRFENFLDNTYHQRESFIASPKFRNEVYYFDVSGTRRTRQFIVQKSGGKVAFTFRDDNYLKSGKLTVKVITCDCTFTDRCDHPTFFVIEEDGYFKYLLGMDRKQNLIKYADASTIKSYAPTYTMGDNVEIFESGKIMIHSANGNNMKKWTTTFFWDDEARWFGIKSE
ncbi:hypothetical protein [Sporomusa sp.]|uniref:hypothetical protein n=1 Tax=Sporomusa sp. TaxID=2078658 RepID=UPI002BB49F74|nr:hypothetical protein [Sporomusa sp.]HWR10053.1 hypothetical protein [Sporomusa sp.]